MTLGFRLLDGIDGYISSIAPDPTYPEAIRAILQDWLVGHGFVRYETEAPDMTY